MVQSYSKDEFCNLVESDGRRFNFRITFPSNRVDTNSKESSVWREVRNTLLENIDSIKKQLSSLFDK